MSLANIYCYSTFVSPIHDKCLMIFRFSSNDKKNDSVFTFFQRKNPKNETETANRNNEMRKMGARARSRVLCAFSVVDLIFFHFWLNKKCWNCFHRSRVSIFTWHTDSRRWGWHDMTKYNKIAINLVETKDEVRRLRQCRLIKVFSRLSLFFDFSLSVFVRARLVERFVWVKCRFRYHLRSTKR